ncbi:MAG: aldehyde dehydrogenase (NADP(+)) [Verrucomicrobiota bacterium]|nr:aldehyde dehydrogenase (NADP(+)) [Verrucomicrobiota bacterium]
MTHHGGQFINGHWVRSGSVTFDAVNPATGEKIGSSFAQATAEEIEAALAAAVTAHIQMRELEPEHVATFIEAVASELMALGDEWLQVASAESGLSIKPRLEGERARTCGQLNLFASVVREGSWREARIDTALPNRQPLPRPDLRMSLEALGPVVIFDASNFPLGFGACGNDMASAIAAGCPVIIKSHTLHPGTNELAARAVATAMEKTKFPKGAFSLLQGSGREVGASLVKHPKTAAVGFTGSESGGRALFDLASARPLPIPVYAEMGSLNPLIIMPGATNTRSEVLAKGLAQSLLLGAGQFCTKPGLIFLLETEATDAFIKSLTQEVSAANSLTLLGKTMQDALSKVTQSMEAVSGVSKLISGKPSGYAGHSACLYMVESSVWKSQSNLHCEAFGPAGVIVRVKNLSDLLECLQCIPGTLTATLHHGEGDHANDLKNIVASLSIRAGRVIFNGFPTGVEVSHAMMHGGPYPATTQSLFTSVGTQAIKRFARPVCYQNIPERFLPPTLHNANLLKVMRLVNGEYTRDAIS